MNSSRPQPLMWAAASVLVLLTGCEPKQPMEPSPVAVSVAPLIAPVVAPVVTPVTKPGMRSVLKIAQFQDASSANKPPTAADLSRFTRDIMGKGRLMATIHTDKGDFKCELFEQDAPMTVANFVGLARGFKAWVDPKTETPQVNKPYYNGILFHRVIPGFMIQTGDPLGAGSNGPGYEFANETTPKRLHKPGTLSMANRGRGTNGSQFFINEITTPHLDGKFSVFGQCDNPTLVKAIASAGNRKSKIKSISFVRQR